MAKDDRKLDPTWFLSRIATDPDFLRETEQAQLIIKVAPGEEVTALVSSLHDFPRTVLDKASALIRSIAQ